jgi:competence protein ComEA
MPSSRPSVPPPGAPGGASAPSSSGQEPPPSPSQGGATGSINLNTVTFEQLREENLSVTQATRLLAHRERLGRFGSIDDLDQVPGFPQEILEDLKRRSTV